MEVDESHVTERILDLALEIICLVTGEMFPTVKPGRGATITVPSGHSLRTKKINRQKILEVTNKITELLMGEGRHLFDGKIIIKEEIKEEEVMTGEDVGEHKELCKETMIEEQPLDGAGHRPPPEGWTDPLYSQDCTRGDARILHHYQEPINMKEAVTDEEEEMVVRGDQQTTEEADMMGTIKEEDSSYEIGTAGGHDVEDTSEGCLMPHTEYDGVMQCSPGGLPITGNTHHSAHTSSDPFHVEEWSSAMSDRVTLIDNETLPCFEHGILPTTMRDLMPMTPENQSLVSTDQRCRPMDEKGNYEICLRSHAGEKTLFSPPECGKSYNQETSVLTHQQLGLNRHRKIHTCEWPLPCSQCGKCFKERGSLLQHKESHTGEQPFAFSECGTNFTQNEHLLQHQQYHTGSHPFSCSECGICFKQRELFLKHLWSHTSERPFSCLDCGKKFTVGGNLRRHQKIHTGERPFACSECGKCFIQKKNLIKHQKMHTGERPFSCSECGKRFTVGDHLHRHQKIHTGERLFACSECGKSFIEKEHLIRHLRSHTGVRPFACSKCGKSFMEKRDLTRHHKTHSSE